MTLVEEWKPGTLDAMDVLRLALTSKVYGAAVETPARRATARSDRSFAPPSSSRISTAALTRAPGRSPW